MKILIYTNPSQIPALETVREALKATIEDFDWEVEPNLEKFSQAMGVFKIIADSTSATEQINADIRWLEPSKFLKTKNAKLIVWNDIETRVLPALRKKVIVRADLSLSDQQLQQLLGMLTDSTRSFELDHPDGFVIGVNKTKGVDVSLTTADIASMLASSWLFKAKVIRITDFNSQGKGCAI